MLTLLIFAMFMFFSLAAMCWLADKEWVQDELDLDWPEGEVTRTNNNR
jgi:hypothetical protein